MRAAAARASLSSGYSALEFSFPVAALLIIEETSDDHAADDHAADCHAADDHAADCHAAEPHAADDHAALLWT